MDKISAVIITYNEEKNIERCILSLQQVADEIIIVDSFSTDRTPEICRSKNVRFYQLPWTGYSDAKNYGNELAENNYIFSIDADEQLSEELRNEILKIKNSLSRYDAYRFNRMANYCGKWIHHCGWYPDTKLRLWNKQKGKWDGLIHEMVKLEGNASVINLKGNLLHYPFDSIKQHLDQANRFTDLTALDLFIKNKQAGLTKIIFSPYVRFMRDFILKKGFMDGYYGYVICKISAFATFLKYIKLHELQKTKKT